MERYWVEVRPWRRHPPDSWRCRKRWLYLFSICCWPIRRPEDWNIANTFQKHTVCCSCNQQVAPLLFPTGIKLNFNSSHILDLLLFSQLGSAPPGVGALVVLLLRFPCLFILHSFSSCLSISIMLPLRFLILVASSLSSILSPICRPLLFILLRLILPFLLFPILLAFSSPFCLFIYLAVWRACLSESKCTKWFLFPLFEGPHAALCSISSHLIAACWIFFFPFFLFGATLFRLHFLFFFLSLLLLRSHCFFLLPNPAASWHSESLCTEVWVWSPLTSSWPQ